MKNISTGKLHTHYAYLKKLECFKLNAIFSEEYKAPVAPLMKSITHKGMVWEIHLVNGNKCYMRNRFEDLDEELYVVHVDALKFYYYWLSSSIFLDRKQRSNECLLLKNMHEDYKYYRAADGFSRGEENPVPLAYICPRNERGCDCIFFINGVTRTMWLLANGAKSFPIEVHYKDTAQYLYNLVGVGDPPISFQESKKLLTKVCLF